MKTKLYRTVTLVLAIVMLLGATPALAVREYNPDQLDISYWEEHKYTLLPYDFNIARYPDEYIPFGSLWEYGDRTSASSKGWCWELEDGVLCATESKNFYQMGITFDNVPKNTELNYFEGNTHIKTAILDISGSVNLIGADNLKLAIILDNTSWYAWNSVGMRIPYYCPDFPHDVTVIGGLVKGPMYIANSNDENSKIIFKDKNQFIEAVKPILASAHMTDKAWSLIPAEFHVESKTETEVNPLANHTISDWAKDEFTKALQVGIVKSDNSHGNINETVAARKGTAAETIINTYEAVCKAKGISTGYPSAVPEKFGPNTSALPLNKGAHLGIFKGDGTTFVQDGKTYANFGSDGYLTREQMAAMLVRLAKACGKTLPSKPMPFTDAMSDWAKPEVSACYGAGLIKGTSATTFGALDNVTGEQAVVLCYRAYVYLTTH